MKSLDLSRCALSACAVVAMLAGCGGLQPPIGASETLPAQIKHDSIVNDKASFRDLYSFCPGYSCAGGGGEPSGSVVLDASGAIYGPLGIGGTGSFCSYESSDLGCGGIFKLTPSGSKYTESLLYSFCSAKACRDGAYPSGALVLYAAGSLYGTTTSGGDKNAGVVFELTRSGSSYYKRTIYSFCKAFKCADGKAPSVGVIFDKDGALFGTTYSGGAHGSGTVFTLTPSSSGYTQSVLYAFCAESSCQDGAKPRAGLVMDKKGVLYGTTSRVAITMKGWFLR